MLAALCLLALAYIAGSALLLPLGVIAIPGAAVLLAVAAVMRRLSTEHIRTHVSPALFVYIAALFVLVRGAQDVGITTALISGVVSVAATSAIAVASGLVGSAVTCNALNNLPGILVFIPGRRPEASPLL